MAVSDIIKQTFSSSLINLLETKSFDKLTIQQLCNHSGLGRQTFYNHFKDKYDIVHWIYNTETQKYLEEYKQDNDWPAAIRKVFYHNIDHKKYYLSIMKSEARYEFSNYWEDHAKDYYAKAIIYRYGAHEIDDRLKQALQFNSYGAVNLSFTWIRNGMRESPESITKILMENLSPLIKDYLL